MSEYSPPKLNETQVRRIAEQEANAAHERAMQRIAEEEAKLDTVARDAQRAALQKESDELGEQLMRYLKKPNLFEQERQAAVSRLNQIDDELKKLDY
jgi:hypothetical protein